MPLDKKLIASNQKIELFIGGEYIGIVDDVAIANNVKARKELTLTQCLIAMAFFGVSSIAVGAYLMTEVSVWIGFAVYCLLVFVTLTFEIIGLMK